MIVITPQCVISFIIIGWGGHTFYQYITEKCELLYATFYMITLFLLSEEAIGASLCIPAFTKGKYQLSAKLSATEVEKQGRF